MVIQYLKRRIIILRDAQLNFNKAYQLSELQQQLKIKHRNEILPADVVIAGYPKSGNTWFQNIIAATVYGMNLQETPLDIISILIPDISRAYYHRFTDQTMYFKSHLLPQQKYRKVVYLVRDGRDALVSYYHYSRAIDKPITWEQLVDTGVRYFGTWQNHVAAWHQNPYQAEMIIMRYEDLLDNMVNELKRFCDFVGIERDEQALRLVQDLTNFQSMQKREDRFGIHNFQRDENFVRRGIKGSFQDEMPPEIVQAFQAQAGDWLARLGYDLA